MKQIKETLDEVEQTVRFASVWWVQWWRKKRRLLLGGLGRLSGTTSSLLSQLRFGDQTLGQVGAHMISGQLAGEQFGLWAHLNAFPQQRLAEFACMFHTLTVLTSDREQQTLLDDVFALQVTLLLRRLVVATRFAKIEDKRAVLLLSVKSEKGKRLVIRNCNTLRMWWIVKRTPSKDRIGIFFGRLIPFLWSLRSVQIE